MTGRLLLFYGIQVPSNLLYQIEHLIVSEPHFRILHRSSIAIADSVQIFFDDEFYKSLECGAYHPLEKEWGSALSVITRGHGLPHHPRWILRC